MSPTHPYGAPVDRPLVALRSLLSSALGCAVLAAVALTTAGCATPHKFGVHAINQSDASMPRQSYRIVDARPEGRPDDLRFAQVAHDVQTALSSKGLFTAPEGTAADLMIEVDYGVSAPVVTHHVRTEPVWVVMPASSQGGLRPGSGPGGIGAVPHFFGSREVPYTRTTYHKFLRLTARTAGTADAAPDQVWSVLVTNEDKSDDLRTYTRLMVAAAMDHIAADHSRERHVVLTRGDRRVTFVEQGMESS